LAGDGGDETFGGYARYAGAALSQRFRLVPAALRRHALDPLVRLLPESTRGFHALRRIREFSAGSLLEPVEMYALWQTYFTQQERTALYTNDCACSVAGYDAGDVVRGLFAECPGDDFVARTMYVDLNSFLPHNVLQYSDRMSMAHGLELRVPFTDPKLMDLVARVPSRLKVRGLETKHIMRKAMARDLP
ncbi:MAG: asparagine synthetase B, partial [bacterium]|nr:asparagine synthetase B [bacterium]